MKRIDIYSDISYSGYQHINQMLFRGMSNSKHIKVSFLYRFYMNSLKLKYVNRVIKFFFKYLKNIFNKKNIACERDASINVDVKKVWNFPSANILFDYINSNVVLFQLRKFEKDTAITFVPSKALSSVFSRYDNLIYYCVHDSSKQDYDNRHKYYEKEIVEIARLVFCDNEDVINRLSGEAGWCSIIDIDTDNVTDGKFYLVPPPVPSPFYSCSRKFGFEFEFVYYGSIHKDIDVELLYEISKRHKILIISFERFDIPDECEIYFYNATSDLELLVEYIGRAKAILLPYKNTIFMDTISPAKINQSLATNKVIYCSNIKLCHKYGLKEIYFGFDAEIEVEWENNLLTVIDKYSEINLVSKIESLIIN